MIKYKAGGYRYLVEPVEIEKETESTITIKGRRHNKRSEYENYFDTQDEALAYLKEKAIRKAESARRNLLLAESEYAKLMSDIKTILGGR